MMDVIINLNFKHTKMYPENLRTPRLQKWVGGKPPSAMQKSKTKEEQSHNKSETKEDLFATIGKKILN